MGPKAARQVAHPILRDQILYVVDPPERLQWANLVQLLRRCGEVRSGERSSIADGRKSWKIYFPDLFHGKLGANVESMPRSPVRFSGNGLSNASRTTCPWSASSLAFVIITLSFSG